MNEDLTISQLGLAIAIRRFQRAQGHDFDSVAVSTEIDGERISLRWSGDLLEIELENGEWIIVDTGPELDRIFR